MGLDVQTLSSEKSRKIVAERVQSDEWWVLLSHNDRTSGLMNSIEEKFYSNSANRDFEVAVIPGVLGIAMMRKRRMSAKDLAEVFRKHGAEVDPVRLEERDLVVPAVEGERAAAEALIRQFFLWLRRSDLN